MKTILAKPTICISILIVLLSACGAIPTATPTSTVPPATRTPIPTETATAIPPTATPEIDPYQNVSINDESSWTVEMHALYDNLSVRPAAANPEKAKVYDEADRIFHIGEMHGIINFLTGAGLDMAAYNKLSDEQLTDISVSGELIAMMGRWQRENYEATRQVAADGTVTREGDVSLMPADPWLIRQWLKTTTPPQLPDISTNSEVPIFGVLSERKGLSRYGQVFTLLGMMENPATPGTAIVLAGYEGGIYPYVVALNDLDLPADQLVMVGIYKDLHGSPIMDIDYVNTTAEAITKDLSQRRIWIPQMVTRRAGADTPLPFTGLMSNIGNILLPNKYFFIYTTNVSTGVTDDNLLPADTILDYSPSQGGSGLEFILSF